MLWSPGNPCFVREVERSRGLQSPLPGGAGPALSLSKGFQPTNYLSVGQISNLPITLVGRAYLCPPVFRNVGRASPALFILLVPSNVEGSRVEREGTRTGDPPNPLPPGRGLFRGRDCPPTWICRATPRRLVGAHRDAPALPLIERACPRTRHSERSAKREAWNLGLAESPWPPPPPSPLIPEAPCPRLTPQVVSIRCSASPRHRSSSAPLGSFTAETPRTQRNR